MARNEEQARKAVSKSLFSNFLTEGLEGIRRGRHNMSSRGDRSPRGISTIAAIIKNEIKTVEKRITGRNKDSIEIEHCIGATNIKPKTKIPMIMNVQEDDLFEWERKLRVPKKKGNLTGDEINGAPMNTINEK